MIISLAAFSAQADTIRLVLGFAPGGAGDKIARFIQQTIEQKTTKNIVVEFKPGAGTEIATAFVAQNKKDETVLILQSSALATHTKNPAYNITQDLIPVVYLGHSPFILVVNANYPYKKVADLKKTPTGTKLDIGSGGLGTPTYVNSLELAALSKNSVVIPFKGMGEFLPALLSNQINMAFITPSLAEQHIQTGKIAPVAVTANNRLENFESVPTFVEQGYSTFHGTWYMLLSNTTAKSEDIKLVQDVLIKELQDPAKVRALRNIDVYYEPKKVLQGSSILAEEIRRVK